MLGAIIGDIIGSIYEFHNIRNTDFPLFGPACTFTDDTILTIATADTILHQKNFAQSYREWSNRYPFPMGGYGGSYAQWLRSDDNLPYGSFGNGSAMRVSPVGWAFSTLEQTLLCARQSAEVTHNHPEGIKGAQAVAAAIFLARTGRSKPQIQEYITATFGYDLKRTTKDIRPNYQFNETCQGSVPEALICFLESSDFDSAVRLSVSIGGDSDTIAAIAGGIAQAYGTIPEWIKQEAYDRLPDEMIRIIEDFNKKYKVP